MKIFTSLIDLSWCPCQHYVLVYLTPTFLDVERLAGDVDQAGVQAEEEEDRLQRDLTEAGL